MKEITICSKHQNMDINCDICKHSVRLFISKRFKTMGERRISYNSVVFGEEEFMSEKRVKKLLEERTKEILGMLEYAAKNADEVCTQITCEWFATHIRKKYGL